MADESCEAAASGGAADAPRARVALVTAGDGPARSLPFDEALARLEALAGRHAELVLAGPHLGAFGLDLEPRRSLAELIRAAVARGVGRIRLGPMEPLEFPSDLLLEPGPARAICEEFQLALHSGSDRVLAAMGVPHRAEGCRRAFLELDALVPGACLVAVLTAGFPGETDDDHAATCALLESLPLARIRVVPWTGDRPAPDGRSAREIDGPRVPPDAIEARVEALEAISARKWRSYLAGLAGRELEVVVEEVAGGLARGVARQGVQVRWPSAGDRKGGLSHVRVEASDGHELYGVRATTFRSRLPP